MRIVCVLEGVYKAQCMHSKCMQRKGNCIIIESLSLVLHSSCLRVGEVLNTVRMLNFLQILLKMMQSGVVYEIPCNCGQRCALVRPRGHWVPD